MENDIENAIEGSLYSDIRRIIEESRRIVFGGIKDAQIAHNWKIGKRIVEEELNGANRAEYGKRTIGLLALRLTEEYGDGYSERYLFEFSRFYRTFPDFEILHTHVQNLSWSHWRLLMRVDDPIVREWYINEASNENWSVRTLDRNICTQYYQRLLISQADQAPVIAEMKKKTAAFQKDKLEFIKNPRYVRMFDEIVKQPDDNPTIGIVLCAETDPDIARYSILNLKSAGLATMAGAA